MIKQSTHLKIVSLLAIFVFCSIDIAYCVNGQKVGISTLNAYLSKQPAKRPLSEEVQVAKQAVERLNLSGNEQFEGFSLDGQWLVTGGTDWQAYMKYLSELDNEVLALAKARFRKIYNTETGENLNELVGTNFERAEFSPNSELVYIIYTDGTAALFNLEKRAKLGLNISEAKAGYKVMPDLLGKEGPFSADNQWLVIPYGNDDFEIYERAFNVQTGEELGALIDQGTEYIELSPRDKQMFVILEDGTAGFIQWDRPRDIEVIQTDFPVTAGFFRLNGTLLQVHGSEEDGITFDATTRQVIQEEFRETIPEFMYANGSTLRLTETMLQELETLIGINASRAVLNEEGLLFVIYDDQSVQLFDWDQKISLNFDRPHIGAKVRRDFPIHLTREWLVIPYEDGSERIFAVDMKRQDELENLIESNSNIHSVFLSPGGKRLLVSYEDDSSRVFDLEMFREIPVPILYRIDGWVFSRNDRWLRVSYKDEEGNPLIDLDAYATNSILQKHANDPSAIEIASESAIGLDVLIQTLQDLIEEDEADMAPEKELTASDEEKYQLLLKGIIEYFINLMRDNKFDEIKERYTALREMHDSRKSEGGYLQTRLKNLLEGLVAMHPHVVDERFYNDVVEKEAEDSRVADSSDVSGMSDSPTLRDSMDELAEILEGLERLYDPGNSERKALIVEFNTKIGELKRTKLGKGELLPVSESDDLFLALEGSQLFANFYYQDPDGSVHGLDLSQLRLPGADMGHAKLKGADFSGSNLEGANFGEAYLEGVDFRGANLKEVELGDAYLEGVDFRGANLEDAEFETKNISGAKFSWRDFEEKVMKAGIWDEDEEDWQPFAEAYSTPLEAMQFLIENGAHFFNDNGQDITDAVRSGSYSPGENAEADAGDAAPDQKVDTQPVMDEVASGGISHDDPAFDGGHIIGERIISREEFEAGKGQGPSVFHFGTREEGMRFLIEKEGAHFFDGNGRDITDAVRSGSYSSGEDAEADVEDAAPDREVDEKQVMDEAARILEALRTIDEEENDAKKGVIDRFNKKMQELNEERSTLQKGTSMGLSQKLLQQVEDNELHRKFFYIGDNDRHVGLDLRHLDFSGRGEELKGADFSGARFDFSNFEGTQIQDARFVDASFRGANFHEASFLDVRLDQADMRGAYFRSTTLDVQNISETVFSLWDLKDGLFSSSVMVAEGQIKGLFEVGDIKSYLEEKGAIFDEEPLLSREELKEIVSRLFLKLTNRQMIISEQALGLLREVSLRVMFSLTFYDLDRMQDSDLFIATQILDKEKISFLELGKEYQLTFFKSA